MATALPIPVTTIGGYLGAGKTTLVNHLLRHSDGLRLAVLVNEFGDLPIDADLIEARGDDLIAIAGGCICCSFGNDLSSALVDLAAMSPAPDHVLIESSGVALPGAIAASVGLLDQFQVDGVVVLADAAGVRDSADDMYIGDTILRQLADADIVVLNKIDLVGDSVRAELEGWLAGVAPRARIVSSDHGRVALAAVLGTSPSRASPQLTRGGHADALFDSLVLNPAPGSDATELARDLAEGPYGVVRAKGFMATREGPMALLHVVGSRWNVTPVAGTHRAELICIGLQGQLRKPALLALASGDQTAGERASG